jgi:hypothetical protein
MVRGIGVLGKLPPDTTHYSFKLVRELDDEAFERYAEALDIVGRVSASLQLRLIEKNHARLVAVAQFYRNAIADRRHSEYFDARKAAENLSYDVLNWLTATRLFLDHHLTSFADIYGGDSPQRRRLQEAIRSEYDNSIAYRVLYKLRDYTQHCGFPVDQVSAKAVDSTAGDWSTQVEFTASRDRLLESFDWKRQVEDDLRSMPERIDILQLVEQGVTLLQAHICGDHAGSARGAAGAVGEDQRGRPHL